MKQERTTLTTEVPEQAPRTEVGMRISPEIVLFVGGAVLTVALAAVLVPFMVRIWRADRASRRAAARGEADR